jgi:hypothetical protein
MLQLLSEQQMQLQYGVRWSDIRSVQLWKTEAAADA